MENVKQGRPDLIYPEKEYWDFYQIFLDLDPALAEELEEADVIEAYNKVKAASPDITMEQLSGIVPELAATMKEKMGTGEGSEEKIAALNSIQEME